MPYYLSLFFSLFLSLSVLTSAYAESRLALVIGNGNYQKAPSLNNPISDANDMARQLRKLGFKVILKHNLNNRAMIQTVQYFGKLLRHHGGIGLFYFSGYALQFKGDNFLLPIDASIESEIDISWESLNANRVIEQMKQANNSINIVILDACRNYQTHLNTLKKGLAKMESPKNFLITYANAPNRVIYVNSRERNSFYTKYLLQALRQNANLNILDMLTKMKQKILFITQGRQVPWTSASLKQGFCFRKCSERWQDVSKLLRTCEDHLQAYRLTTGEEGNAFSCYKKVLKIEQNNPEALEGLEKIEAKYVDFIEYALSRGREEKAQEYMVGLRKVNPKYPKFIFFKKQMQASKKQQAVTPPLTVATVEEPTTPEADETESFICPSVVTDNVFRDCFLEDNRLGPQMVWIPGGSFKMGDLKGNGQSDENPVHSVTIKRFAMGRYEVTFAEYDKFVTATGRINLSDYGWGRGKRPVIGVSWEEALAYTEWLSEQTGQKYRLPTEAEWEYAARARTERVRYWGNDPDVACSYANVYDKSKKGNDFAWTPHNCTDGYANTAPVGHFKANAFGLFDMLGNVWEWTCSQYERKYSGKEKKCIRQIGDDINHVVLRGGGWDSEAVRVRSAFREMGSPSYSYEYVGFRLVRE